MFIKVILQNDLKTFIKEWQQPVIRKHTKMRYCKI